MTKKFQQPGDVINWVNGTGAAKAAGTMVVVGHMLAVLLVDVAIGGTGAASVEGVFAGVPKVSAAVFAQGEKLIFDVSAAAGVGEIDDSAATPASGDITGGCVAWVAGANLETTCTIKLTPGNATKTA